MSIYIKGMEMPHDCDDCRLYAFIPVGDYGIHRKCLPLNANAEITIRRTDCPLIPIPEHGRLKRRVVYRGDVFNALESARIIALDGILTDRYKDGFHDGLKRALEILANEVQDAPTIIQASEETA